MRKAISYFVAVVLGVLCVAPPLDYSIPIGGPGLFIDPFRWLYCVILAGLFGFFILFQEIHILLKIIVVYLFCSSYLSQAPAESFNAYILVVVTLYLFILCQKCDFDIIINMLVAVFFFQITIAFIQHAGLDKLTYFGTAMNFDQAGKLVAVSPDVANPRTVYFGTVFQQMRFASLLCCLSPFLVYKSKWFLIPIMVMAFLLGSLGFSLAVCVGLIVYLYFTVKEKENRSWILFFILLLGLIFAVRSFSHIRVEIVEGRLPVWWVVIKSWCLDTSGKVIGVDKAGVWVWNALYHNGKPDFMGASQTGPLDWTRFWFGHGLDTFGPMFRIYKHDMNAFNPAHNTHLQYLWEGGIILFCLIEAYFISIFVRLKKYGEVLLFSGAVVIWINMFLHFPGQMTQTIWILVAFAAFCEQRIKNDTI